MRKTLKAYMDWDLLRNYEIEICIEFYFRKENVNKSTAFVMEETQQAAKLEGEGITQNTDADKINMGEAQMNNGLDAKSKKIKKEKKHKDKDKKKHKHKKSKKDKHEKKEKHKKRERKDSS